MNPINYLFYPIVKFIEFQQKLNQKAYDITKANRTKIIRFFNIIIMCADCGLMISGIAFSIVITYFLFTWWILLINIQIVYILWQHYRIHAREVINYAKNPTNI